MTGRGRRSPGAELALTVMRLVPPPLSEVSVALSAVGDPAGAAERLTFHGAWGHAHRLGAAVGRPLPPWLADEGAGRRAWALENHLRTIHDLTELQAVLDGAGVRWLAFKGPTLSSLYDHPDLRGYADLDVLVAPGDLRAAVAALLSAGWPFVDPPASLDRRPPVGELHLTGPAGTPVDLHWHLFYRADHRSRGRLDTDALVAARQHTRIGRTTVPTLPLGEHLAYVCAHAAAGGGNRLRWLLDVGHLAVRASERDWAAAVAASRAWGVRQSVSLMLSRAVRHVGADVPVRVIAALTGRGPRALSALAELIDPLERSQEKGSATPTIARAADRWTTDSVRAALANRWMERRDRDARPAGPRRDLATMPGGLDSLNRFVDAVPVMPFETAGDGRARSQ